MVPFLQRVPAATDPILTGAPWVHIEKDLPSSEQMISPSVQEPEVNGPLILAPAEGVAMTDEEDGAPKEDGTLEADAEADAEAEAEADAEALGRAITLDELVALAEAEELVVELELEPEPESEPE